MAPNIILTGGTSGIGLQAVRFLARMDSSAKITATGRSQPKEAYPPQVTFAKLDLCSQDSIRSFVSSWKAGPITHLILNAGASFVTKPEFNEDGIELSFAANHTGHALLVLLLIEANLLTDDCSIIFVTTALHDPDHIGKPVVAWTTPAKVAAADDERLQGGMVRYGTTKVGGVLFAWALLRHAKRAGKHWRINCYEPGFTPGRGSKLGRDLPGFAQALFELLVPVVRWYFGRKGIKTSTPENSGKILANFALSDEFATWNGRYLFLTEEGKTSKLSYDQAKQDELWDWTIQKMAKDDTERRALEAI